MDINATAKEYGTGIITSLKKNRRMLLMMLLFAAGMIFGAASVKKSLYLYSDCARSDCRLYVFCP